MSSVSVPHGSLVKANEEAIDNDDLMEWAGAIQQGLSNEQAFNEGASKSALEAVESEKRELEKFKQQMADRQSNAALAAADVQAQIVPSTYTPVPILKRTIIEVFFAGGDCQGGKYGRSGLKIFSHRCFPTARNECAWNTVGVWMRSGHGGSRCPGRAPAAAGSRRRSAAGQASHAPAGGVIRGTGRRRFRIRSGRS